MKKKKKKEKEDLECGVGVIYAEMKECFGRERIKKTGRVGSFRLHVLSFSIFFSLFSLFSFFFLLLLLHIFIINISQKKNIFL